MRTSQVQRMNYFHAMQSMLRINHISLYPAHAALHLYAQRGVERRNKANDALQRTAAVLSLRDLSAAFIDHMRIRGVLGAQYQPMSVRYCVAYRLHPH